MILRYIYLKKKNLFPKTNFKSNVSQMSPVVIFTRAAISHALAVRLTPSTGFTHSHTLETKHCLLGLSTRNSNERPRRAAQVFYVQFWQEKSPCFLKIQ